MAKNTVYVITGANRGLGLGLAKLLIARPFTTIIATVRTDKAAASLREELLSAASKESTFEIVQLDFSTAPPLSQVQAIISSKVDYIDVLICNAAISPPLTVAAQTTAADLRTAFEVNTIGPLTIFQGLWPLLKKSAIPKLINITSSIGCITSQEQSLPGGAYGPSKAALNWITRALHLQNKDLVAIALHPGWVQTDMGAFSANTWGFLEAPETVENSVRGMVEVIDSATRDTTSGKFVTYKGQILPW